jgi:vacuolar-type H+-ATPase subunit E/Vma4
MPAEEILDHIKQTSDEEVKEILTGAAKEATAYITGQRGDIQKKASKLKDRLDKEAEAKKRLIIAKMRRDAAQKEFATKEALIKETFDMAWDSLKSMSTDRYKDKDKAFFKSKDTTVEDPPDGYLKKQIAEGGGGFIIQSQDGSVTVDYTFKGIIERKMEPLRIGVAKILFAEE